MILLIIIFTLIVLKLFLSPFNSEKWKNSWQRFEINPKNYDGLQSYSYLKEREKQARFLIVSKKLKNLSKKEVENELGLDDNDFEKNKWFYWINFTSDGGNKLFVVEFDLNNKVLKNYFYGN